MRISSEKVIAKWGCKRGPRTGTYWGRKRFERILSTPPGRRHWTGPPCGSHFCFLGRRPGISVPPRLRLGKVAPAFEAVNSGRKWLAEGHVSPLSFPLTLSIRICRRNGGGYPALAKSTSSPRGVGHVGEIPTGGSPVLKHLSKSRDA